MRGSSFPLAGLLMGVLGWLALPGFVAAQSNPAAQAFLTKHCVECHGATTQKGDFRVDTLPHGALDADGETRWKAVLDRVTTGSMPPAKKARPEKAEQTAFVGYAESRVTTAELARQKVEGRVALRRLNRIEYENTVRDLLGVPVDVKTLLPADGISHGFDNVSEALNVSSVQMQRYLEAADVALKAAIATGPRPVPTTSTHGWGDGRAAMNIGRHWLKRPDGSVVVFISGTFPSTQVDSFRVRTRGRYKITMRGYAFQSKDPLTFALYVGNFGRGGDTTLHGYYEFPPENPGTVEVYAWLDPGDSLQILPYGLNHGFNVYKTNPDKPETWTKPGLALSGVDVEGPVVDEWPTRGHRLLFGDLPVRDPRPNPPKGPMNRPAVPWEVISTNPERDAQMLLARFLSFAFRRPATPEKLAPYLALFNAQRKDGASFQDAMTAAATAALCSPDFLFLRETPGRLDDYALASRLSYFLWRTMPDDELFRLASQRKLGQLDVLRAQTERMLRHPNAQRFTSDFTDAWLNLRDIDFTTPDRILYPEYDDLLKDSMMMETRMFFNEVLTKNLPVSTFLASDFVMLNERLAKQYRIPDIKGLTLRKVPNDPKWGRGGLLTQGAVLKVSANGTNTSPVVRGVYVLERFLGVIPPPPPPGVPAVEPDIRGAKTVRELLDKHRSIEACAGCHKLIDPPGFALEEYDVIGGKREKFRAVFTPGQRGVTAAGPGLRYMHGLPVDASGEMLNGRQFQNFADFQKLLLAEPEQFAKCLTEKLLTFATGREIGPADRPAVSKIVTATASKKYPFRDLIHAVVQSETFRTK